MPLRNEKAFVAQSIEGQTSNMEHEELSPYRMPPTTNWAVRESHIPAPPCVWLYGVIARGLTR